MQQGKARSHGKGAMKKGSEGEGVKVMRMYLLNIEIYGTKELVEVTIN